MTNKLKIFNDPIYGFITIPSTLIFDIIEHPYFQRLRRVSQMGLSNMVYPGAHHTRFHHVIGCMYLMQKAVRVLRSKGITIDEAEEQALYVAILLHDIGHGPFSHALEHFFIPSVTHEDLSLAFMNALNKEFEGKLTNAIAVFTNKHPRKFLYQLISSQLDMDRLDYLKRDSFYTGVVEGSINSDRLIAMLNVADNQLVIEHKGIYSIEQFLLSRRFMYWQVYFHKTGLLAERILLKTLERGRALLQDNKTLFASNSLLFFLKGKQKGDGIRKSVLTEFANLDDYDIWSALKEWQNHEDFVLSSLSKMIIQRKLPSIELSEKEFTSAYIAEIRVKTLQLQGVNNENLHYFMFAGQVSNRAYNKDEGVIKVLLKDGRVSEWLSVDTQFNTTALTAPTKKYYLAYPKNL